MSFDSARSSTYSLLESIDEKRVVSTRCCCCCCYEKKTFSNNYTEDNNSSNSSHDRENDFMDQKEYGFSAQENDKEQITLSCHWRLCIRNALATWVVVGGIFLFSFYIVLPLILTSFMNKATVNFSNIGMSDRPTALSLRNSIIAHSNFLLRSQTFSPQSFMKLNDTLLMTATCRLEDLTIPVDVGIITKELNVYHHSIPVGRLVPEEKEITVYQSLGGNFSLPAYLKITNMSAFHSFASDLLNFDHVKWDLITEGPGASIRLRIPLSPWYYVTGGSSSKSSWYWDLYVPGVKFNKSVIMKGCNGFHNTSLELFTLDDLPSKKYANSSGLNVSLLFQVTSCILFITIDAAHVCVFSPRYI